MDRDSQIREYPPLAFIWAQQIIRWLGQMAKRVSYFIRAEGPDRGAVKKALEWLLQVSPAKGFVAVPGLRNLDGVLAEELGPSAVKDLKTKGKALVSGRELYVITRLKPVQSANNAAIVAFYPYGRVLDALDAIRDISAILIVPWSMQEVDHWVSTWNAKELGSRKKSKKADHVSNRVVEEALRDISDRVNMPAGMEHQTDRDLIIQALLILKEGGEEFTPSSLKSWLVANGGWKATHAQEVAEAAAEVLEGKRFNQGKSAWPDDVMQKWRARRHSTGALPNRA